MNNIYYVYMYLREDGTPYYIGKGKGNRAYYKARKQIQPPKDKNNIRIIEENLCEDTAFMWEEFWINFFGRIDLGTGCLHNKTNGGEGMSGRRYSDEEKIKILEKRTKTISNMSETAKNKTKLKRSNSVSQRHNNRDYFYEVISPDSTIFKFVKLGDISSAYNIHINQICKAINRSKNGPINDCRSTFNGCIIRKVLI